MFPQGDYPCYLTQPGITRQRPLKIIYIEYDRKNDEISRVEHVEYNTSIGKNIMNKYDIKDFLNAYWT